MGAFIIMNAAANAAAQRIHDEELEKNKREHELKMKAQGFVKEKILLNPSSRYCHEYKNISKQSMGVFLMSLSSAVLVGISVAFLNVQSMSLLWAIPFVFFGVLLCIGLGKFYNKEFSFSGNIVPEPKPGCYHLRSEDNASYGHEWVKKKK